MEHERCLVPRVQSSLFNFSPLLQSFGLLTETQPQMYPFVFYLNNFAFMLWFLSTFLLKKVNLCLTRVPLRGSDAQKTGGFSSVIYIDDPF